MSSYNCCFLTWIQISRAGQVVWYSHLFQNFPQFIVIHTVKGFGIVNKTEIDVFLELSCFFHDPADVGNSISGSSAFSKASWNIWKFTIHVLMKPGLENFEHYFTIMWDECSCAVVWAFFGIAKELLIHIFKNTFANSLGNSVSLSNSNTVCFPLRSPIISWAAYETEYLCVGAIFYKNLYFTHTQNDQRITAREVYENQYLPGGQFRSPVLPSCRGTHSLSGRPASLPRHPRPLPRSLCLIHRDVHSLSSHFLPCPLHESVSLWQLFIHWLTHIFSLCFSVPHAPLSGKNIRFQDWLWDSKTCHLHCCPGYRNVLGFVFIKKHLYNWNKSFMHQDLPILQMTHSGILHTIKWFLSLSLF